MDYDMLCARIDEVAAAVREYHGTAPMKLVDDLLSALEAKALEELADVKADGLENKQGQLRQLRALRDVLANKQHCNGTV